MIKLVKIDTAKLMKLVLKYRYNNSENGKPLPIMTMLGKIGMRYQIWHRINKSGEAWEKHINLLEEKLGGKIR